MLWSLRSPPTAGKKGHGFDGFDLGDRLRSPLTPLSVYLTSYLTMSSFWFKIKMNAIVLLYRKYEILKCTLM